jgi:hypothetical protein
MINLPRLDSTSPVVEETRLPTLIFQKWWQLVVKTLENVLTSLQDTIASVSANTLDLTSLTSEVDALQIAVPLKQDGSVILTGLSSINSDLGLVEQTGDSTFSKRPIGVASSLEIPTRGDADNRYFQLPSSAAASVNLVTHKVPILVGGVTYYILLSNI